MLNKGDIDSLVETVNEDKVCRELELFSEEVGLPVKMLGDVDLVVEANDENEVCRMGEIFGEDVG